MWILLRTLVLGLAMLIVAAPISPGVASATQRTYLESAPADAAPVDPSAPDREDTAPVALFGEDAPRLFEDLDFLKRELDTGAGDICVGPKIEVHGEQRLCPSESLGEIFRPPWLRS